MELENDVSMSPEIANLDFAGDDSSPKTAQRIRYESEVDAIRARFGNLEQMREKLGLSRRRLCEVLMVDPSAWTRWTAAGGGTGASGGVGAGTGTSASASASTSTGAGTGEKAPAHVYKTMALLMEKFLESPETVSLEKPVGLSELRKLEFETRREIADSALRVKVDVESQVRDILETYRDDIEKRMYIHFEKTSSLQSTKNELNLGWKILILLNLAILFYGLFLR